jgi:hypothetical protein
MTREDIENELEAMVITTYGGKHLGYYGVLELFKKQIEDFESEIEQVRDEAQARVDSFCQLNNAVAIAFKEMQSRTCENCEHGKELLGDYICTHGDIFLYDRTIDVMCNLTFPKDFGCNKWENKDDT